MKRLALFLAVAALGATAFSYYHGLQIEREFHAGMSGLDERPEFPAEVQTTYDRGVFQSTATTRVTWATPTLPALTLEHRIAHGPIPWAALRQGGRPGSTWIESRVSLGLGSNPVLGTFFGDIPPLSIQTHVGSAGGVSTFHWPAFEGGSPETGTVSISELRGEVGFGGANEEAVGSLEWDGMALVSPLYSLRVSGMSGEFAYEDILKASVYGQSAFQLESISAQAGGRNMADLRNFTWSEQRAVEGDKMFLNSKVGIESLNVMGFSLREGSLETRFENLDLSVWERVRQIGQSVMQSSRSTTLAATGAVAADPSFSLELRALANGEMLSAKSHARFGDGAAGAGVHPETLMRALDADLALRVPATLLDAWIEGPRGAQGKGAQLRVLRDQGVLRRTRANAYETRLEFRDGEIRVNGVPYEALKQLGPGSGPSRVH
jgi:uncharacterized protein YdgA (DUF945 family)